MKSLKYIPVDDIRNGSNFIFFPIDTVIPVYLLKSLYICNDLKFQFSYRLNFFKHLSLFLDFLFCSTGLPTHFFFFKWERFTTTLSLVLLFQEFAGYSCFFILPNEFFIISFPSSSLKKMRLSMYRIALKSQTNLGKHDIIVIFKSS